LRVARPKAPSRLEALEEIFLAEGYSRVRIGELAARLRCSRRTLYEVAPTKDQLFVRVLDGLLARIREKGDAAVRAAETLEEKLAAYLAPGIEETRHATRLFARDVAALPAARRLLEQHQRTRLRVVRELVEEGVRRKVFRGFDPHLVAEVMTVAYRRATEADFLSETKLSLSEAYRELSALLRHGLLHAENGAVAARRSRARRARAAAKPSARTRRPPPGD
jgi:AcrR family transcriptional regulator